MLNIAALLLLALGGSLALNLIFIRFFKKMGALSAGNKAEVRWASRSKPLVGGIVFFMVFLAIPGFYLAFHEGATTLPDRLFAPLLITSVLGFLVGLADDAYNTRPLLKFSGQFLCGILMIAFGVSIKATGILPVDYALTILWVVGIMNSFNMIDNMDGVSGSVSLGVLSTTAVLMALLGDTSSFMFYTMVGMIGAHLGFLILNWHPSKLYMGDTGSQFLGALLAFVGIEYFWNQPLVGQQTSLLQPLGYALLPLLVFLMTILDTTFVTFARLGRGQSPFVGGRDHVTHHLVYLGVNQRFVALITGGITFMGGAAALWLIQTAQVWSALNLGVGFGVVLLTFGAFFVMYRTGARKQRMKELAEQRSLVAEERAAELVRTAAAEDSLKVEAADKREIANTLSSN